MFYGSQCPVDNVSCHDGKFIGLTLVLSTIEVGHNIKSPWLSLVKLLMRTATVYQLEPPALFSAI